MHGFDLCGVSPRFDLLELRRYRSGGIKLARISLGLPVYNGEQHIGDCLASIVNQTFEDFELIVSDNASTDRTMEIVQDYAASDQRIRIVQQPTNLGAARNFNLLFEQSDTEFFKWCACDDQLEPTYLEETYVALKGDTSAVLCHTHTVLHNLKTKHKSVFVPGFDLSLDDRAARLHEMLAHGQHCYEVFGLIRRDALKQTELIGNYRGGDNVLLARLALLGTFIIVPQPLFILGLHEEQSIAMVNNSQAYHAWFTGQERRIGFPDWVFLAKTWGITRGLAWASGERTRCYQELVEETYRRRFSLKQNVRFAVEMAIFGSSDPLRRRRFFSAASNR